MTHLSESRRETQRPTRTLAHPKHTIRIGNWNVRTLYQGSNAAQASREMRKKGIDVMGISETHWIGQGRVHLSEGTEILPSGRDDDIHREGVAIMMTEEAARSLMDWTPVNERIIKARFYSKYIKLTLIHTYAPTEIASEQVKDDFYTVLQEVIDSVHQHDILIITGDMNAKVGSDNRSFERVMGTHGLGVRNDNGERLCSLCDANELVITGTIFPRKDIHKKTWRSPDGITENQIDHTLVRRKFRKSSIDTRVMRSADIGSDHFLVCTSIKLMLMKARKEGRKSNRIRFDTDKLKHTKTKQKFIVTLKNKYQALENHLEEPSGDEIEDECKIMEMCYMETAKEVLGKKRKRKKPWIIETSWRLIEQRIDIHKKILTTHSERLKGRLQDMYREKDREVKSR